MSESLTLPPPNQAHNLAPPQQFDEDIYRKQLADDHVPLTDAMAIVKDKIDYLATIEPSYNYDDFDARGDIHDAMYRLFSNRGEVDANNESELQGLANILESVDRLEIAFDNSLFASMLNQDMPSMVDAFQTLYARRNPTLLNLLERSTLLAHSLTPPTFFQGVEQIVGAEYGFMSNWKTLSDASLPNFMHRLIERRDFATNCLQSEIRHITNVEHDKSGQMFMARDAERRLLTDVLGVDEELGEDFRLAIMERTLLRGDDGSIIPPDKDGGINVYNWEKAMLGFIRAVNTFGVKNVNKIYKECGLVNLDRYTVFQLDRMVRFVDKDPQLLEHLRKNDTALMVSDALGDHNGAIETVSLYEDDEGTALFFETSKEIFQPLIKIATEYGVTPSTLVIGTHGTIGRMQFGTGTEVTTITEQELRRADFANIVRTYMRPHSVTGERHVIFDACLQAAEDADTGYSTAELAILATKPADQIALSAFKESIFAIREGYELRFFIHEPSPPEGKYQRANVHTFRRQPATGRVTVDITGLLPSVGRRP